MDGISRPHPAQVPTLTEVIDPRSQGQASPAQPVSARPPVPLDALPVLGEVVDTEAVPPAVRPQPVQVTPVPVTPAAPAPAPAPSPAMPAVTEAQLAHRVLSDVQRQVDSMLEFRLKEAMGPLLARHTEAIVRDLRDELNKTLKDVVARSVAQELAKLRQR